MAFATKNTTDVKEFTGGGNSKYIGTSGMFPVNIIVPFINPGKEKASTIDLFVEYEGQKQVIYGSMSHTNRDGNLNKIGMEVFNKLMVVTGTEEVADPVDAELPIGKKGADKPAAILEDLADVDAVMQVRMEYSVFNNNIMEKTVIKSFFRAEDNASAEEIVAAEAGHDVEFGSQYATLAEGANFVTYDDGLDAEKVAQWIKDKRPKGTGNASAAPATKKPSFGQKKFGK